MPNFGKRTPFTEAYFRDFETAYKAEDRHSIADERWNFFSREQIKEKNDSLDLGLIADENLVNYDELPEPLEIAADAAQLLKAALNDIHEIMYELSKSSEKMDEERRIEAKQNQPISFKITPKKS
jgi:type I restriction enzyme M protein